MARARSTLSNLMSYVPPEGCLIIFNTEEVVARNAARRLSNLLEIHKINGEFINHTSQKSPCCDLYICMKGNLDDC